MIIKVPVLTQEQRVTILNAVLAFKDKIGDDFLRFDVNEKEYIIVTTVPVEIQAEKFCRKYGRSLKARCAKLLEETQEFTAELLVEDGMINRENLIDELADINFIVFHLACILNRTQEELLVEALDKARGREKNQDYKRKHPHEK